MIAIKNAQLRLILKLTVIAALVLVTAFSVLLVSLERRYVYVLTISTMLSLFLFMTGYENKRIGSRRLVIVSIMTAFSVIGRFVPLFKPISAITIITAMYLGGEAGFLVGALSALISGFYFGIGPWTPFQMLAWGLIGLFAGYLSKPLVKSRVCLMIYGIFSGIAYSFVMDVWTVLFYSGGLNLIDYYEVLLAALPYTALYVVSNLMFLFLLARPIGKKLERVKIKYGI